MDTGCRGFHTSRAAMSMQYIIRRPTAGQSHWEHRNFNVESSKNVAISLLSLSHLGYPPTSSKARSTPSQVTRPHEHTIHSDNQYCCRETCGQIDRISDFVASSWLVPTGARRCRPRASQAADGRRLGCMALGEILSVRRLSCL